MRDGFYRDIIATLDDAWVRPRLRGWPQFQDAASATVRAVLRRDSTPSAGASRIVGQFRAHVTF